MLVAKFATDANRDHRISRGSAGHVENESLERRAIHPTPVDLVSLHRTDRKLVESPLCDGMRTQPKCHESLRLPDLGERCPFDRAGIEDRRSERAALEIRCQNLMPVNVPGQHGSELRRDISAANHVRCGGERKVARSDHRAFDAVVDAEKPMVGFVAVPVRLVDQRGKLGSDIVTLVWKSRQCDPRASDVHGERAWDIEDVDVRVRQEARVRKARPLMVAGDDEDRNAEIGDSPQRLVGLVRNARVRRGSIENVAAMDDEIDVARQRRGESGRVVREKIESASPASDPWPDRQIEAEVGIGEKQDSDGVRHLYMV